MAERPSDSAFETRSEAPAPAQFDVAAKTADLAREFQAAHAAEGADKGVVAFIAEHCRGAVLEARDSVLGATSELMAFVESNHNDPDVEAFGKTGSDTVTFVESNHNDDDVEATGASASGDVTFVESNHNDDDVETVGTSAEAVAA